MVSLPSLGSCLFEEMREGGNVSSSHMTGFEKRAREFVSLPCLAHVCRR